MNTIPLPVFSLAPSQPNKNRPVYFAASSKKTILQNERDHLRLKSEPDFPNIPLPKATQKDYGALVVECLQSQKGITAQIPSFVRLYFQLRSEQKKAEQYLPPSIKKHLKQYHYSWQGLSDRWFNKSEFLKKTVVIKGTAAIKDAQAEAEFAQAQLVNWELISDLSKGSFTSKFLNWHTKNLRQTIQAYRDLKDQVPLQSKAVFEEPLNFIQKQFQKNRPNQNLKIGQAIAAGSIAQIFEGTITEQDKKPKKVVIKVLRPDAKPAELLAQRNYLYYRNLLRYGADMQGRKQALEETDHTLAVLEKESHLENEAQNALAFKAGMSQLNIGQTLHIPRFYLSTPMGFVQEKAGNKSLTRATRAQRLEVMSRITPILLKTMLFSPEKYLDFHDGNIRFEEKRDGSVGKVYLIDFGRFARLNAAQQEHLLKLLATIFSKPALRHVVPAQNINNAVETLVDIEKHPHFKDMLPDLKAQIKTLIHQQDDKVSRNYAAEQSSSSLIPLLTAPHAAIPSMDLLIYILTGHKQETDEAASSPDNRATENYTRNMFIKSLYPVSIFNAWANYTYLAQMSHNSVVKNLSGQLKPISNQAISPDDLAQITKKFQSLFRIYFTQFSDKERADAKKRLQNLNMEQFRSLFLPLEHDMLTSLAGDIPHFQSLQDAAQENDGQAFQTAMRAILKTAHEPEREYGFSRFTQALLVTERLENIASILAEDFNKRLPTPSPHTAAIINSNLIDTLREDFKIAASDFSGS